jgi:hypothetical protein
MTYARPLCTLMLMLMAGPSRPRSQFLASQQHASGPSCVPRAAQKRTCQSTAAGLGCPAGVRPSPLMCLHPSPGAALVQLPASGLRHAVRGPWSRSRAASSGREGCKGTAPSWIAADHARGPVECNTGCAALSLLYRARTAVSRMAGLKQALQAVPTWLARAQVVPVGQGAGSP